MANQTLAAILSSLHLLGLGLGMGGILVRAWALQILWKKKTEKALPWVLQGDNFWGIASLLWISTGLMRVFMGMEKPSAWYLGHDLFWVKMGVLGLMGLIEFPIMFILIKYRVQLKQEKWLWNESQLQNLTWSSWLELALLFVLLAIAPLMARGIGYQLFGA